MSFESLLNQTVRIYGKTSYNKYGREVVGSATSVDARFELTNKSRLLPNGQTVTIVAKAFVPPDTTVAINDKLTYNGQNYKVYGVYSGVGGNGRTHHLTLDLITWQST